MTQPVADYLEGKYGMTEDPISGDTVGRFIPAAVVCYATAEGSVEFVMPDYGMPVRLVSHSNVKRFMKATSTNGEVLIAAVAGKRFRVRSLSVITTSKTVTNVWLRDSDFRDVYGDSTGIPVDADGGDGPPGFVLGKNEDGWFETAQANKDLVLGLTAAQKVVVCGTYEEVD